MNDVERIDVWCPGERRVVGDLPRDVGLLTKTTFRSGFRPATGEYRLQNAQPDGGLARCPRCGAALAVFSSDVNVALSEAERREVSELRAQGRAQYGDAVPTRAEIRAEIEHQPVAAGAVVRHFAAEERALSVPIVLGSTRVV